MRPPRSAANANDLGVPDRHVDAVRQLLDGQYGTVMQEIARDAVCRAWMDTHGRGYMPTAAAVLLDITEHARKRGVQATVRTGVIA